MKLKPYPKYKDSEVEWLGEIPENWGISPLKYGYQVSLGKMLQPESKNESDVLLPYLRAANVQWNCVDTSDVKEMWISANERESLLLKNGDLLVSEGGDVGRSAIWNAELAECYFQNSINRIRPIKDNSNKFLYYWISTVKDGGYIDILCNKSTIAHFTAEKVQALPVTFPTPKDQGSIANFLDRETAKLDTLIAKQEKLIELLQEKRKAIISHAVTKGLNPHANMKDSGLAWLGEVPSHWVITRLKYLGDAIIGLTYAPDEVVAEGTLVLRSSNIQQGAVSFEDNVFVNKVIPEKLITKIGDILICSRNGSRKLIGKNITIDENTSGLSFGAFMTIFRTEYYRYVSCILNSSLFEFQAGSFLTSTVNQLTTGNLNSFEVPFPPEDEQIKISEYINHQTNKIDSLIEKAKRSIELANEHRIALISAAVTGKIDVREAA